MKNSFLAVASASILLLAGCSGDVIEEPLPPSPPTFAPLPTASGRVGVVLPESEAPRWGMAGDTMQSLLDAAGVQVTVDYGDAAEQATQIDALVSDGADIIVLAPADELGLAANLDAAENAGVDVIAFDRIPVNAAGIDYFVAPDMYGLGIDAGVAATTLLGLTDHRGNATGVDLDEPLHVEVFGADLDEWDYWFFHNGVMQDGLANFIAAGDTIIGSGEADGESQETSGGTRSAAEGRMSKILRSAYSDGEKLDAVITASSDIAAGVRAALTASDQQDALVITVGDDLSTMHALGEGEIDATVFYDIRELSSITAETVVAMLLGEQETLTRTQDYFTNTGSVTTRLLWPSVVTAELRQEKVIATGYYTADQLKR
ncbi:substrate-binding domain-containing protein [Diaminobutyricimonas sp. TR449]|uniref:substrate-binding domain-containing protein n=1 Tax=Diaminobutyricimonas sp. TR449 TaxID=2708076 RepID=UPI00141FE0FA|nr:substrate-binding domain-containing protein [Diaminobutyricimonas sp. TR449]